MVVNGVMPTPSSDVESSWQMASTVEFIGSAIEWMEHSNAEIKNWFAINNKHFLMGFRIFVVIKSSKSPKLDEGIVNNWIKLSISSETITESEPYLFGDLWSKFFFRSIWQIIVLVTFKPHQYIIRAVSAHKRIFTVLFGRVTMTHGRATSNKFNSSLLFIWLLCAPVFDFR